MTISARSSTGPEQESSIPKVAGSSPAVPTTVIEAVQAARYWVARTVTSDADGTARKLARADLFAVDAALTSLASNEAKIDALTKTLEWARDELNRVAIDEDPFTDVLAAIDAALSSHTEQEGWERG